MRCGDMIVLTTLFLVAGCAPTLQQRQAALNAQDDETCKSYGVQPGAEAYSKCREQVTQAHEAEYEAALNYRPPAQAPVVTPNSPEAGNAAMWQAVASDNPYVDSAESAQAIQAQDIIAKYGGILP